MAALAGIASATQSVACNDDLIAISTSSSGSSTADAAFFEDANTSSSSSAGGTGTTCLDQDPIDTSTIPYEKASATVKGACTEDDLTTLSDYYKTHGADESFSATAWESQVSRNCGACVFTDDDPDDPPATWNPILIKNDQLESVDQGGCIENVSGSFACGKAFQQLEVCQVNACLVKCNTQQDFEACRQDTTVLTTACKNAVAATSSACGSSLPNYETACNSTNFAFEGPIRNACITPPVLVTDAGAPDAGDAGDGAP